MAQKVIGSQGSQLDEATFTLWEPRAAEQARFGLVQHRPDAPSPESAHQSLAGGVIEIAGLTALIGSSTAELLMLGSRGAGGVVWASMSIFGVYAAIKACIGALVPTWLRGTLGVQSAVIDQSIGASLDLRSSRTKLRLELGKAMAIQCAIKKARPGAENAATGFSAGAQTAVYAFDQVTERSLNVLPPGAAVDGGIYLYNQDPFDPELFGWCLKSDLIGLTLSLLKLAEIYSLYHLKAFTLCWITGGAWVLFLLWALGLSVRGCFLRRRQDDQYRTQIDLLTGQLPTAVTPGHERLIILGLPKNPKHHVSWKFLWLLGATVLPCQVFMYYFLLGGLRPWVFYTWGAFQVSWLLARMAFFHFASNFDQVGPHGTLMKADLDDLNTTLRARIHHLASSLSTHLISIHPRGHWSYKEDAETVPELDFPTDHYPTPSIHEAQVRVHISAVIGDTLLTSVCWASGIAPELTGLPLYDSCIVRCTTGDKLVSIPAARVLSAIRPKIPDDLEVARKSFFPAKGGFNLGQDIIWNYWIPCGDGLWLEMQTENMQILGDRVARVLTDDQLTQRLQRGELFVSLKSAKEVKETVRTSSKALQVLLRFRL